LREARFSRRFGKALFFAQESQAQLETVVLKGFLLGVFGYLGLAGPAMAPGLGFGQALGQPPLHAAVVFGSKVPIAFLGHGRTKQLRARPWIQRECKWYDKRMISQQELSQMLEELGYPTSVRKLTDWRQKDLLPSLQRRGRGLAKGQSFYWQEPDILQRAHLLSAAFDDHVTADRAALLLAFAGFDMDAGRIRQLWVKQLGEMERKANGPREINEYADDRFWDTGLALAKQLDEFPGVDSGAVERLTVEGLKTVYAQDSFCYGPDELDDIAAAINAFFNASLQQKQIAGSIELTVNQVDRVLALLRLHFGCSEIKALITSCSVDQFRSAMRYLINLVKIVEYSAVMFADDAVKSRTAFSIRATFRSILGPILLPLFLRLINEGHENRLKKSERVLSRYLLEMGRSGIANAQSKVEKAELMKNVMPIAGKRFSVIWKNFDLFRLYHLN
jgi:hypothetical protein